MNAGRDVERLIADWLIEEAPGRAPDRILVEAGRAIDRTGQRRFIAAWRERMPISMRGLAAAAAIGAVLIGGTIFALRNAPSSSVGGGPVASPSPSASPTPSASPGTSASPSASQAVVACDLVTADEAESQVGTVGLLPTGAGEGDDTTCVYADGGGDVLVRITWLKVGGRAAFETASAVEGVEAVTEIAGVEAIFDPALGKLYMAIDDALVTVVSGRSSEGPASRLLQGTALGQLAVERM